MSEDFKIWWHNEGSGMPPFKEEETCDHVERVSAIAWSNGAFKATLSLEAENARLKAEVERLRLQVGTDAIDREHGMCCDSSAENARLKAEVERLRKAGDAMAKVIPDIMDYRFDGNECDKELKAWNAAKEGKQP